MGPPAALSQNSGYIIALRKKGNQAENNTAENNKESSWCGYLIH
jgi:hypothetical protein